MTSGLTLAGSLTVRDTGTMKAEFLSVLEDSHDVVIDVSEVREVDTAGAQLLLSFVRAMQGQHLQVSWQGESSALTGVTTMLGMQVPLGMSTTPASSMGDAA